MIELPLNIKMNDWGGCSMSLVVRTGPQEYICQQGVLANMKERLADRGIERVLIVHGNKSWQKAEPFLNDLIHSGITVDLTQFNGEATYKEVDRVLNLIQDLDVQAVLAVGGGKLIDTVKYAASKSPGIYSVVIPTLASNCAPWTPISVMYDEDGVCLGFDILGSQVSLLAIEPDLVVDSPLEYFIAGIGDTIAKWYESQKILAQP